ncbi:MAG TPA: hypothetical protein P5234_03275 [Thermoanaerobaculaceae bacterium]|nr:hypothetical protein [Thermoanaerobaculaceae bacterium]HRS15252.1 hypothetical protein [Thermoanaerobaculaceae bacterium]
MCLLLALAAAGVGAEEAPVDLTKVMPYTAPPSVPAGGPVPNGGSATLAILDDFNRADGPIGPNWTVHDGSCNVSNNAAVCSGQGRATFNGAPGTGDTAELDVANNTTSLQYAALLLNYGAGSTNLFLKVQNQFGGNQFGHAACYTGNNGDSFGLGFFALSSPFSTAHMKATRSGTTVTLEFTNIDGGAQPDQTYVCTGAPAAEGTGVGIGGYAGLTRMDNFAVNGGGLQPADVSGTKTVSGGPYRPGGTVTYTIVLSNAGPGTQGDNPGNEFEDTLPPQLTATGASASSGTLSRVGNYVTWNGAIPSGGSVTISISAVINPVPAGATVSNQGTIRYDGSGSGSNGSTRLTDDPAVSGSENPTTFVVAAPEPIPALGPGGLAGLALLVGLAALLLLRRLG